MKETHMLLIYDCSVAHAESGSRFFNEIEIIFICTTYLHHTCAQTNLADGIRRMCLFGPSYSIAKIFMIVGTMRYSQYGIRSCVASWATQSNLINLNVHT